MSRTTKSEKKDFSFVEVVETFKTLAEVGVTPEDLKTIRSNREVAVTVALVLRASTTNISPPLLSEVSSIDFFWMAWTAAEMTGAAYVLIEDIDHRLVSGRHSRIANLYDDHSQLSSTPIAGTPLDGTPQAFMEKLRKCTDETLKFDDQGPVCRKPQAKLYRLSISA